jgi:hypothetical protein
VQNNVGTPIKMKVWDTSNLFEIRQFEQKRLDYALGALNQKIFRSLDIIIEPWNFKNDEEMEAKAKEHYRRMKNKDEVSLDVVEKSPLGVKGWARYSNPS